MATGPITERYDTNPLIDKWKAFGWHVSEIDGHNISEIIDVLEQVEKIADKPKIIIARTIKVKVLPLLKMLRRFITGSSPGSNMILRAVN